MAVSRHNGRVYNLSREHSFTLWLFLSVGIHLIIALIFALSPIPPKKVFYSTPYEVELLPRPEVVRPEEVTIKEEVRPPEEPKKAEVRDEVKKIKKPVVTPKVKKDTPRADEAISKLREKIAVQEAVKRIRKKVEGKETALKGEVKFAARPPARVYHYEELDAELKAYFDKITHIINEAWSLPEALRNKGYRTVLSIHIRRDGTIESLFIEEGSGNRLYDESTLRAINKVTPLPPLPKGWKEEAIDLGLRF